MAQDSKHIWQVIGKRIPVGSSALPFRYDRCDGNGLNIQIDL